MKKAVLLLMMFAFYGCDQAVETPAVPIATTDNSNTGVVLETIDVDSYTYMRLDTQGSETWIASSPASVSEGDVVKFSNAMLMKDFNSKALDRTFPSILFVSGVELISATPVVKPAHADEVLNAQTNAYHEQGGTGRPTAAPVNVQALEGGKTIAAIYAEHKQLEGKEVTLRARVVKFSPNILNKNWITLQDGTGTAEDSSLLVTSSQTVEIGDEVIVSGLVKSDVDLGAGYAYKVLLEQARFE